MPRDLLRDLNTDGLNGGFVRDGAVEAYEENAKEYATRSVQLMKNSSNKVLPTNRFGTIARVH